MELVADSAYPTANNGLVVGARSFRLSCPAAQVMLPLLVLEEGLPGKVLCAILYPPRHPSMPAHE